MDCLQTKITIETFFAPSGGLLLPVCNVLNVLMSRGNESPYDRDDGRSMFLRIVAKFDHYKVWQPIITITFDKQPP